MSTENAIFQLTNDILQALDNKQTVAGIFCDLSKAFNCVDHETLLVKLEYYGISGVANKLIRSYLEDRYQRVQIKSDHSYTQYSDWKKLKRGIPQGSILGPLLFLYNTNDLPNTIIQVLQPTLFVDDISLTCTQMSRETLNEEDCENALVEVNRWFQTNSLRLNLKKPTLSNS